VLPGLDVAGVDCISFEIAGEPYTVAPALQRMRAFQAPAEHIIATVASLWGPFLGQIFEGEAARIRDWINLNNLAPSRRVRHALNDLGSPQEDDMGVQAAATLIGGHV
jgi:hypothetical protein